MKKMMKVGDLARVVEPGGFAKEGELVLILEILPYFMDAPFKGLHQKTGRKIRFRSHHLEKVS